MKKENFLTPLYLATAKESIRPIMNYVHFIGDYMYATNAHILIKQHNCYCNVIDKEKLDGKIIHRDSFQKIMKFDKVIAKDDCLECYNNKENSMQIFNYGDCENKLPVYEQVLTNIDKIKEISCVRLNIDWLDIACKCLYTDNNYQKDKGFIFTFLENNMLKIDSKENEFQIALVMQMLL